MSTQLYFKYFLLFVFTTALAIFSYFQISQSPNMPMPTETIQIFEGQLEGEGQGNAKEEWLKMSHRAAPGTDWKAIDRKNRMINYKNRKDKNGTLTKSANTYANGNLTGNWEERGSNNQSGSLREVEYDVTNDKLYGISDGGTIWKGNSDGTDWEPLNEALQFDGEILKILPSTGFSTPQRIISAIGKIIYYSDDDAESWTAATGFDYWDTWGNPLHIVSLDDQTIYYLVRTWQLSPWGAAVDLYYSNDRGATFSKIANYLQWNYERISLWSPYNSNEAFLLENGANLHSISGSSLTLLNSNTDLPTDQWTMLSGAESGGTTTFYALSGQNTVYRSTDNGANWSNMGATPVNTWNVGFMVSPFNSDFLIMGAVDCYYSSDGGASWTKANEWWQYYSNTDLIHADIMDIKGFAHTDGTEFHLIANHGGLHVSFNEMATTSNISTAGLNIGQYYDVRTDPSNTDYFYAGAQDQGHQRSSAANAGGMADFNQVISGDYGHMAFSGNGTSLWTVYPGGWVTFYPSPQSGSFQADYDMIGTHPAVSDWITPTAEFPGTDEHTILIAGGNITGGSGSYLVKLTATNFGSWSISASQFDYDFRANSTSGTATISAIAVSPLNAGRFYVATSDGTFFFSTDGGNNWNKSATTGPGQFWLYGASILPSSLDENLVWFGGSGYSNPAVYKSTDGGATFTAMDYNLPNTLVQELTANNTETLLFAATEVGAYTYVVSEDTWYSLMEGLPQQRYYSAEFISPDKLRLGSYGRGIWDFEALAQPALPVEWISFEAQKTEEDLVNLNWITANEFDNKYFEIQKSDNGKDFENIGEIVSQGNGVEERTYEFLDRFPLSGDNYYRLKQIDKNGDFEYSNIQLVHFDRDQIMVDVFPNPAPIGEDLKVKISKKGNFQFVLFNQNGQRVLEKEIAENGRIIPENVVAGYYFYQIFNEKNQAINSGKILLN